MSAQPNPYAPPVAEVRDVNVATSADETIRQEHIKHEASIRSIGTLYYIGGLFAGIAGIVFIAAGIFAESNVATFGLGVIYVVLGVLSYALGNGVRRFRSWARTTAIVFACIGLLGFPLGTLINGYILYLLLSAKGKRIFAPDYPDIVAATPHIKYRTSVVVWVVLGLLIAAFVAAIAVPMMVRA